MRKRDRQKAREFTTHHHPALYLLSLLCCLSRGPPVRVFCETIISPIARELANPLPASRSQRVSNPIDEIKPRLRHHALRPRPFSRARDRHTHYYTRPYHTTHHSPLPHTPPTSTPFLGTHRQQTIIILITIKHSKTRSNPSESSRRRIA